jgi:lipoate-protein ligase A
VSVHDLPPSVDYARAMWRVIIQGAADGPTNMAIDEAIGEQVAAGAALPTLRFYLWKPPCLSLGYSQPASDVDFERLRGFGWDIVRRPTGGRAILHTDELTYSIAAPDTDPHVMGGIVESYRRLSAGLLAGLDALGAVVHAERAAEEAHHFEGPVCFEVPSDYEITVRGRKLLGSAQTRRGGHIVLQHGALPLYGDITRICDTLAFPSEAAREEARARVLERAITLEEALGARPTAAQVVGALIQGFAQALNLELDEAELTPAERIRAEALRAEKYAADAWTYHH